MKRYLSLALVLAATSAVIVVAQTKQPATGDDAIFRADRTLVAAFEKGDKATIGKLLDADFSWIDTDGIMWAREDCEPQKMRTATIPRRNCIEN